MNGLLFLHLIAIAFWAGCLCVELVLERSRGGDFSNHVHTSLLHYRIDLFVEIPAFTTVLITGFMLLDPTRMEGLYLAKVFLGLGAICVNILCVIPVMRRRLASLKENREQVLKNARLIDLSVLVGVPMGLTAFLIGLHFMGLI